MLDALASIAPSCMFFAIGEQLNALTGLLLCLYMTWHHMENPKRDGLILMISGVIVFFLCGIACCLAHVPSLWSVIPSAPVVVLALRKMTNLPWGQLLFVVSTAAYIVAIIYYLSLAVDLAVLNEQSMNLRVGWPGMISLLIFDLIAATILFHSFHHSFSATFDSPSISRNFWRVIWLFPFISTAIVVWCMPADNASLLDTRVLSIAFTVSIAYSGFMTMAYFLIWYMVQQADRLREASKREHYEAMQTLQLQHMNERINEARQIKHNIRHHIQTLQAFAAADDMPGITSYLEEMANHRLLQPIPMQYCEHASLNAVLVYYCDWIRHIGAEVDVKASVPQYLNINNAELCSMVGNLLENASEAIMKQQDGEKNSGCASNIALGRPHHCSLWSTTRTIPPLCRLATLSPQPSMGVKVWAPPPCAKPRNGIMARPRSIMTARCSALPSCCVWMIEIPVRRRPITVRSSPRMAASHGFRRVEI